MKNLTETLNASINEAREEIYSVCFNGLVDKEGLPLTVNVYVPREYAKDFEKYLDKEGGNTVDRACGQTNDYELDF